MVLTIVANVFQVLGPLVIQRAIDALGQPDGMQQLVRYLEIFLGVAIVLGVSRFLMRQLLNGISRRIENDLRQSFFDHLMQLDATFFSQTRTGDLMSRAVNDIGNLRQAIGPAVMYSVNTFAFTVFSLFVMIRTDASLTLIAIIPMVLLAPLTLYFGRILHERYERISDQLAIVTTMVQENLSGARIVRAYVQEEAQQLEFERLNREYFDRNMQLAQTEAVFNPLLTFLANFGLLLVIFVGGLHVIQGRITIGVFIMFLSYVIQLTWPMIAIGWVTNLFQRGAASLKRIQAIVTQQSAVQAPRSPITVDVVRGEIEFRNVSFRYPNSTRDVLKDVTFTIPAGHTAAIVGPTGSGKSTIVSLLTRRYDRSSGDIFLDDVDIKDVSFEQLRSSFGVVPQESFVFSETIAENIALGSGSSEFNEDAVRRVARIAKLDEAVVDFPMGYKTRLGERGVNLSGGQRQRTTLARALARDPRILILDDALSAVDTHTETDILKALRVVLNERTSLIISHRVTAVMNADIILVLDGGRIVERGRHDELVEKRGLYSTLLRRQLLEEGLEGERAHSVG
ncbi:MAG TPA: ABC transporter ATP-binding protein [Longimicrobiales bacterium]|nr:ABC transporter ATP-binding protein [Longimicrobiales bacterium]